MLNYVNGKKLSEIIARLSDLNERGYDAWLKSNTNGVAIEYRYTRVAV